MIGIKHISSYIPSNTVSNLDRCESLGSSQAQIQDRIGFIQLSQMRPEESTLSLAEKCLQSLIQETQIDVSSIEVLVVVSQNQDRNIPHLSAEIHGKFSFSESCACFDIGLGCSGYVYALSIISGFMKSNGFKKGILITADPYSRIVNPQDKSTALLFGDAATATLMDDDPIYKLGQFTFGTAGKDCEAIACNEGILSMNGRGVYNFAAQKIPKNIIETININNISIDEIDTFLVHQGSRFIVETIAERMNIKKEKFPFMASNYGNTVSSSIPLMLKNIFDNPEHRCILLSGFGLGLSWSSTVLKIGSYNAS